MSKGTRLSIWIVLAVAILLAAFLAWNNARSGRELAQLRLDLEASRKTWERIAAEKEDLQNELEDLTYDLREAQLTLEEKTARAAELREEIALLQAEIQALQDH